MSCENSTEVTGVITAVSGVQRTYVQRQRKKEEEKKKKREKKGSVEIAVISWCSTDTRYMPAAPRLITRTENT